MTEGFARASFYWMPSRDLKQTLFGASPFLRKTICRKVGRAECPTHSGRMPDTLKTKMRLKKHFSKKMIAYPDRHAI
jgi:hypothetical protein